MKVQRSYLEYTWREPNSYHLCDTEADNPVYTHPSSELAVGDEWYEEVLHSILIVLVGGHVSTDLGLIDVAGNGRKIITVMKLGMQYYAHIFRPCSICEYCSRMFSNTPALWSSTVYTAQGESIHTLSLKWAKSNSEWWYYKYHHSTIPLACVYIYTWQLPLRHFGSIKNNKSKECHFKEKLNAYVGLEHTTHILHMYMGQATYS